MSSQPQHHDHIHIHHRVRHPPVGPEVPRCDDPELSPTTDGHDAKEPAVISPLRAAAEISLGCSLRLQLVCSVSLDAQLRLPLSHAWRSARCLPGGRGLLLLCLSKRVSINSSHTMGR